MKNWRIWVALGAVVLIAAAGFGAAYVWWLADAQPVMRGGRFATVERGPITIVVRAAGSVAAPDEQTLTFSVGGRIAEILVQEGQSVQPGAPLALLDPSELEIQVEQAQAALALSEARLVLAERKPRPAEIRAALAALEAAEARLADAQTGVTEADLAAARAALASAEERLASLQDEPSASTQEQARLSVDQARNTLWSAQAGRDAIKGSSSASDGQKDQSEAQVLVAELDVQLAQSAYAALFDPPTEADIRSAEAQVAEAKARLARLLEADQTEEIKSAVALVDRAGSDLEALQNRPYPEEVSIARAQVRQSELALDAAVKRVRQATIVAPMAGTVISVVANAGQSVFAGTPVLVIADLSTARIEAQVHETYIGEISPGQAVQVSLDARPGQVIEGTVSEIAPLPQGDGPLVTYRVDVNIDPDQGTIRPGMTADLEIAVGHRESTLLVPRGALRRKDGQWVVQVVRKQRLVETTIETGARLCALVEAKSGLSEGEQVLVHTVPVGMQAEGSAAAFGAVTQDSYTARGQ